MLRNEYLEKCLEENKGNEYLLREYKNSIRKNFDELIVDNLSFIYIKDNLIEFKKELIKAGIKEFILADDGRGLIGVLHILDMAGIKIKEVIEVGYIDQYMLLDSIKGLKMIVESTMSKEKFLDKLLRYVYEDSITIKIITEDGEDKLYTIENKQDFLNKAKNKYESLLLEHFAYEDLESRGINAYDCIVNDLKEKIIDVAPTIQEYKDDDITI